MVYHYRIELKFNFGNRSKYSPLFTLLIKFKQSSEGSPLVIGAVIRTNSVFIANGWRFKQGAHPIVGLLVSFIISSRYIQSCTCSGRRT